MKKLLSILTISTLTASIPAPLLANTSLTRAKRDVSTLTSNSNNDYLPIKEINDIDKTVNFIVVGIKNNVYFGTSKGAFVLKHGETTAKKIDGINDIVNSIAVDSNDNIYFVGGDGAYVLKHGETKLTPINEIKGFVYSLAVDSKNNIYFGTSVGAFVLKHGATTAKKIDGINDIVNAIAVDSNDNLYCVANEGAFVLKHGATTAKKIDGIGYWIYSIINDNSNNIFFNTKDGFYVLKHGETKPTPINGISGKINSLVVDKSNNIYVGTTVGAYKLQNFLSWVKTNINVTLIDKAKNIVWLRDDQLVANGQVKVKIANNDIDTVKVNGAIMPSPDKNWEFDLPVDSTTVENKDYKIEIAFKLDGKSYTGQIIVSSLLSQPSIFIQKNTAPFGNVASYVYQVPTNDKVGEFTLTSDLYYSDTEVKISLNKPTGSTTITAQIFGLDEKWEKNKNVYQIFDSQTYNLDGSQLNSYQGRYLIETEDNSKNKSSYYVVVNKNNLTPNFWNTDQGQQFYAWANLNRYNESIKKLNATELNKIINESKNWQQLASDSQFATAVADWFKTNGKLSSKEPLTKEQVIEQLITQIPSSITIPEVNTSNYDVNKVSFELNQSEFKPNDKVNITVKYNNATSEQFTLQQKEQPTPPAPDNKKGSDSKLWIIGVVVGVLAGLGLAYWLFKRFVFDKYIYPKIIVHRHNKLVEQIKKEEAEKDAQNNNKGGDE